MSEPGGSDMPGGGHGPRSECFAYDKAGSRRRHRTPSGDDLVYELDAADAVTRIVAHGTGAVQATYVHDAGSRLVAVTHPARSTSSCWWTHRAEAAAAGAGRARERSGR